MTNVVIGITGNIAAGKSTISQIFAQHGYSVQDADKVVHDIYNTDKQAIALIAKHFPEALVHAKICRNILRETLKQYPEKRQVLESIVHPLVEHHRSDFIGIHKRAVLDIPLLFESDIDQFCDIVVTADCPDDIRKKRVLERGVTEDIFKLLNGAQMPQTEKCNRADIVINTNQPYIFMENDIKDLIYQIEVDFFDA